MRIWYASSRLLARFLVVVAALLSPLAAALAQDNVFAVHNIAVDATADDAAAARDAAITQGHNDALQALLRRLVPRSQISAVPPAEDRQVTELVQDFSVSNERTSGVRYLAELTVRFNPESIRQYLRSYDVAFAETQSDPLLVLPVLGTRGNARLWREPNPWRHIWSVRNMTSELVPIISPLGDLDDVAAIDSEQALEADPAPLEAVAARYGAEDVLVSQMRLQGDPAAGGARADITATRYTAYASRSFRLTYNQQQDESGDAFLARARDGVVGEIQDAWKEANLLRYGQENQLMATVPVRSVSDWMEVKRRLDSAPLVVRSELALMTRNAIEVQIVFMGDEDQLARTLAKSDLILTPDQYAVGWWQLMLNAGAPHLGSQSGTE